jgi:hypothetical protein
MFKDINGKELRHGDIIKLNDGRTYTLYKRYYSQDSGIRASYFGGRERLCMGDFVSEPTPDYVEQYKIEKI